MGDAYRDSLCRSVIAGIQFKAKKKGVSVYKKIQDACHTSSMHVIAVSLKLLLTGSEKYFSHHGPNACFDGNK